MALWQPADAKTAVGLGVSEMAADAFLMPKGILPRLALLACGYSGRGDKLRTPADRDWWKAPFGRALWEPLATWASIADKAGVGGNWDWEQDTADGISPSLDHAIATVRGDLDGIIAAKWDHCDPYIIPSRAGAMPLPNVTCVPRAATDPIKDVVVRASPQLPWWAWLGIAYVVSKELQRRWR